MQNKFYSTIRDYYDYIFPLNATQTNFVNEEFPNFNNKLIEVGCANGKLTNSLSQYDIRGIDLEDSFIQIARERYPLITFDALDMLKLSSLNEKFDGIICFGNTLVHLETNQIKNFIDQCYSCLKSNGKLLIQILNYDNILDNKITSLPIIDNDHIRFVRKYKFGERLGFETDLTIKELNKTISNSISLTPIRKTQLTDIIREASFTDIKIYGAFNKTPLKSSSLPLVLTCKRA